MDKVWTARFVRTFVIGDMALPGGAGIDTLKSSIAKERQSDLANIPRAWNGRT